VIGDVGSGKSSLLNAIIGDLLYLDNDFVKANKDLDVTDPRMIEAISNFSSKKLSSSQAPITLTESVAFVQ
jgi:GTPase SAR1 family protein